jgi:hypothetical protein
MKATKGAPLQLVVIEPIEIRGLRPARRIESEYASEGAGEGAVFAASALV